MNEAPRQAENRPAPGATEERLPYAHYTALILTYQSLFALFLLLYRGGKKPGSLERISGLDMTMLALATLRVSKTISEDEITRVLREPLVEEHEGQKQPRGRGLRWSLGKLVLCPTCTGTWVAALLTYSLHLFPRATRPFLAVMAASGSEQFSDALLSLVYTDRDLLRKKSERG